MCMQLVTLAFDAMSALLGANGNGHAGGESPPTAMIQRYLEAARKDAGRAAIDQRSALDRLMVAERRRLDAKRADDGSAIERFESAVVAARTRTNDAARRHTQAQSDCAFAEARVARSEGALHRGPGLTGQALRTFAVERIRQLDEIAAVWGTDRPSRDRVLFEELRSRFQTLSLAKRGGLAG